MASRKCSPRGIRGMQVACLGMDGFLIFLFMGLAIWLLIAAVKANTRKKASTRVPAQRLAGAQPQRPTAPTTLPPHVTPRPYGELVEAWAGTRRSVEVVGENYRDPESFRRLIGNQIHTERGAETTEPAVLVDDSGNPYDSNAVAIYVKGEHVGFLDRETALEYHPAVADLARLGRHLVVPARTWARSDSVRVYARVTVYLPDPSCIRPVNGLPAAAHVILPGGSTIQVTKEEDHMEVLTPWLDHGTERPIAVTLHTTQEARARSAIETVEIRLDGERVGILTPTQAANMLPLVKHVEQRRLLPVARAILKGSPLRADVVLHVAKAQDVDPAWLQSLGPVAASE